MCAEFSRPTARDLAVFEGILVRNDTAKENLRPLTIGQVTFDFPPPRGIPFGDTPTPSLSTE
jgi:hypothetical protein